MTLDTHLKTHGVTQDAREIIVVTGDLMYGYHFYGPFYSDVEAQDWQIKNVRSDVPIKIIKLRRVESDGST